MSQDWKDLLKAMSESEEFVTNQVTESEAASSDSVAEDNLPTQTLRIVIDKKGRKGKTATIIEGFTLDDEAVEEIASELKKKIGTGGSSRGGEILLQGEWKEKATAILKEKGFKVK